MLVRDDIVCSPSVVASPVLAIGHLLVCIVWIWVLKDHVPGVKEAGKEAETAEGEVDEGVGAAKTFLDPDAYRWEQDAEKHQKAVGATHDDGFEISRGGAVDTGGC